MVCPDCGREHENLKGKCPFCSTKPEIIKRQTERPSHTIGGGEKFICEDCGQEITKWKDDEMAVGVPIQIPDHVCPVKK